MEKVEFIEFEKELLEALKTDNNVLSRHMIYHSLIDASYKLRDEDSKYLEKCIHYCKEDIEALPEFLKEYRKEWGEATLPDILSLERLAIIYDKMGLIKEAIDVCNRGIELGFDRRWEWYNNKYGAKKGLKVRLMKLEQKLIKHTKK